MPHLKKTNHTATQREGRTFFRDCQHPFCLMTLILNIHYSQAPVLLFISLFLCFCVHGIATIAIRPQPLRYGQRAARPARLFRACMARAPTVAAATPMARRPEDWLEREICR
jgi:hypothetical protein